MLSGGIADGYEQLATHWSEASAFGNRLMRPDILGRKMPRAWIVLFLAACVAIPSQSLAAAVNLGRCDPKYILAEIQSTGQVPILSGCRVQAARRALSGANYDLAVDNYVASTEFPEGTIVDQKGPSESHVVYVNVSSGPPQKSQQPSGTQDGPPPYPSGGHDGTPSTGGGDGVPPQQSSGGHGGGHHSPKIGKFIVPLLQVLSTNAQSHQPPTEAAPPPPSPQPQPNPFTPVVAPPPPAPQPTPPPPQPAPPPPAPLATATPAPAPPPAPGSAPKKTELAQNTPKPLPKTTAPPEPKPEPSAPKANVPPPPPKPQPPVAPLPVAAPTPTPIIDIPPPPSPTRFSITADPNVAEGHELAVVIRRENSDGKRHILRLDYSDQSLLISPPTSFDFGSDLPDKVILKLRTVTSPRTKGDHDLAITLAAADGAEVGRPDSVMAVILDQTPWWKKLMEGLAALPLWALAAAGAAAVAAGGGVVKLLMPRASCSIEPGTIGLGPTPLRSCWPALRVDAVIGDAAFSIPRPLPIGGRRDAKPKPA